MVSAPYRPAITVAWVSIWWPQGLSQQASRAAFVMVLQSPRAQRREPSHRGSAASRPAKGQPSRGKECRDLAVLHLGMPRAAFCRVVFASQTISAEIPLLLPLQFPCSFPCNSAALLRGEFRIRLQQN